MASIEIDLIQLINMMSCVYDECCLKKGIQIKVYAQYFNTHLIHSDKYRCCMRKLNVSTYTFNDID